MPRATELLLIGFLWIVPPLSLEARTGAPPPPAGSLSLYFTSNGQGELHPCNCSNRLGGLARRVGYIESQRAAGEPMLVVDAGDTFFRPVSGKFNAADQEKRARLIAAAMKAMGYSVVCPGEQDLTMGLAKYRELCALAGVTPVCANLLSEGKPALDPVAIREAGGFKIACIGVIGKEIVLPHSGEVAAANPIEWVTEAVRGAIGRSDAIVLLSHMGYESDLRLAARVGGIDYIIGAHSGELSDPGIPYAGTSWHQVASKGKYVGHIRFSIEPAKPRPHLKRLLSEAIPMDSRWGRSSAWERLTSLEK